MIGSRRGEVRNSPQEITEVSIVEAEQVIVSMKLYLKYAKFKGRFRVPSGALRWQAPALPTNVTLSWK
jgi:hypothetical protein